MQAFEQLVLHKHLLVVQLVLQQLELVQKQLALELKLQVPLQLELELKLLEQQEPLVLVLMPEHRYRRSQLNVRQLQQWYLLEHQLK
jgi:hypothetical protein